MRVRVLNASLMAGEGVVNGFTEAMKKVFTGGYYTLNPGHPQFNQELIRMTLEHRPDVIFLQIQTANILKPEIAREIAKNAFVIQFSGDIRHDTESFYYDIGKEIHLTTFTNMRDVINCRKLGVKAEWLEIGFDPARFRSWENIEITHDVMAHFNDYGSLFPNGELRRQIAGALKEEFGSKFDVYGSFPGSAGNLNHDQVEESKNYCRSKIAINCSNFTETKYSSDRILRIIGSGIMCLTHYFKGIEEMYVPGRDLVTFKNIEDLIWKCKYFLEHEEERIKIAKAGQQHALKNYTFDKMAENIKNFYSKHQ